MSAHINCHLDNQFSDWHREEERAKLLAELKLWKQRAEYLHSELENIPKALREYGEWYIKVDGEYTHVILDPKHHPAKAES